MKKYKASCSFLVYNQAVKQKSFSCQCFVRGGRMMFLMVMSMADSPEDKRKIVQKGVTNS